MRGGTSQRAETLLIFDLCSVHIDNVLFAICYVSIKCTVFLLILLLRKTPAATIAWRWLPTKNEHGGRGHRARHCCGPPWVSSVHRHNQVPALDLGSSSSTSLRMLDTTKRRRRLGEEAVCGAKTAGFKTTCFEPQPSQ